MSELTLDELTLDNVSNLSEEKVSTIMSVDINKLAKEKRSQISNLICTAFDFRTISARNRTLKNDLGMFGFHFYPIPDNKHYLLGVKRKNH